ncbi:uncharacterized protein LOC135159791 isoform X1 [Diachasmimorpha longicaudata]|uniref:uncharacterized protein LOC135159791 isoform X1 n=1 Tax=Diachasmimorpha longicaudata TaxID=58733 RepID=UPI0030B8FB3C
MPRLRYKMALLIGRGLIIPPGLPGLYQKITRRFLIRENALMKAPKIANRNILSPTNLSEEERRAAINALKSPIVMKHLDDITQERPELRDNEGYKVLIPTKYKKTPN